MVMFPCYLVSKDNAGAVSAAVMERAVDDLPPGDVLIEVAYSSLNYKDALSATGNPGVTRKFPHVPGIDAAGTVATSSDSRYQPGDRVLVTGHDLGSNRWGGYAGFVRVPGDWVIPLPENLSLRDAMTYGTAGLTAAQGIHLLQSHGVLPGSGEVLVTGASGGVGSLAVAMLAQCGYTVVAVTGKADATGFLQSLGARRVLSRAEVDDRSNKPLLSAQWAGAIDTVGGNMLTTIVKSTSRGGCVTCCGLVGGTELPLNIMPFILRGVALAGIDSAECPRQLRLALWQNMAGEWRPKTLPEIVAGEVNLSALQSPIREILAGKLRGRMLVYPTA